MTAVAAVLSAITLAWVVILLPFRQKYYPLNSKTALVFLTFISIIILTSRKSNYEFGTLSFSERKITIPEVVTIFCGRCLTRLLFKYSACGSLPGRFPRLSSSLHDTRLSTYRFRWWHNGCCRVFCRRCRVVRDVLHYKRGFKSKIFVG